MNKFYFRYFTILLPALLVAFFFKNATSPSIVLQWFFSFFMILGFGVNTAFFSYRFPRAAMSFIFGYTGINLLIITLMYSSLGDLKYFLRNYGGILSYVPLEIMVKALLDFNINHEVYVTLFVAGSCLLGFTSGLIRRRVHPNPYRPKIG